MRGGQPPADLHAWGEMRFEGNVGHAHARSWRNAGILQDQPSRR
jgi:hypothetical protein